MPLNPLAPVTDYQSMLARIFWFTTASALAAVWMLRAHVPALDGWLREVDFTLALGGDKLLPTPGGYLLPALAVGMASRVFRLHGRVSDWLGIRESFDIEAIIGELAARLDIDLDSIGYDELRQVRHRLMRTAFYPYVSGSRPAVDELLVQQALDAWSWFWIGVEAIVLFTLAGFGLVACGVYRLGLQTVLAAITFAGFGMPMLRGQCRKYAAAQVRAILADRGRAAQVRAAFAEALGTQGLGGEAPQRMAA